MTTVLSLLALLVALAALTLVLLGRRTSEEDRDLTTDPASPPDVQRLRREVAGLKEDVNAAFRHLAIVRYDAFADMGGHLSWSVALLDDVGNGVVITSIHGRYDTRTYAKGINAWESEQQLSPEEETAVGSARPVD